MDWTGIVAAVLAQVLPPLLTGAAAALVAWIVARLPGPVRDFLASGTHARDVDLVARALGNSAAVLVRDVMRGRMSASQAADTAVSYARDHLPEVLAKLRPSEEALRTMAQAAVERALANPAPAPAAREPA